MLNLNATGTTKNLFNPQNIYDGVILALNYMPTKPVAVATAAIISAASLYVIQPETLVNQISTIAISSGFGWAATETAHQIGSKLWKKKLAQVNAELKEYEKTPEGIESKHHIKKEVGKLLDQLFSDPTFSD